MKINQIRPIIRKVKDKITGEQLCLIQHIEYAQTGVWEPYQTPISSRFSLADDLYFQLLDDQQLKRYAFID